MAMVLVVVAKFFLTVGLQLVAVYLIIIATSPPLTFNYYSSSCNNFLNTNFYLNSSPPPPHHLPDDDDFGHHMNRNSDERCSQGTKWSELIAPAVASGGIQVVRPSLFPIIFPPFIHFSAQNRAEFAAHSPAQFQLIRQLKWVSSVRLVNHIVRNMGFQLVKWPRAKAWRAQRSAAPSSWLGFFTTTVGSSRLDPRHVVQHPWQKYNQIPSSHELCYKIKMWENTRRLMERFSGGSSLASDFPFVFETYAWPSEVYQFLQRQAYRDDGVRACRRYQPSAQHGERWIFKSSTGSRSHGICMFNTVDELVSGCLRALVRKRRAEGIIQRYLTREDSYLIAGRKLRYRVFVLVTSVHPLRIYVYNSAEPLTLFNVFEPTNIITLPNDEFEQFLEADGITTLGRLRQEIDDALIKMLFSVQAKLEAGYRTAGLTGYNAFQTWSADFILDKRGRPLLMEMNRYFDLMANVKTTALIRIQLVLDTLNLVGYHFPPGSISPRLEFALLEQLTLATAGGNSTSAVRMQEEVGPLMFDQTLYTLPAAITESGESGKARRHVFHDATSTDKILEHLTWAEVKHLMVAEDELSRAKNYRRVFPTSETDKYLKYLHPQTDPHMYRLQAAWEMEFGEQQMQDGRSGGIELLRMLSSRRKRKEEQDMGVLAGPPVPPATAAVTLN